jgi:nitrosocyanin
MNRTVIVIALIIVLIGGFALVQSQKTAPQTTQTTTNTTAQPTAAMKEETSPASGDAMMKQDGAVKEFTVEGKNFSFTPSTMTVNKGDTVKITFKNSGGMHDFKIDEFNVATKQIQSGASETVEFTADKAGTFDYYCSVGNHRAMGMQGTLTVK